MYKTIYDIEVEHMKYFSSIFKTMEYEPVFVYVFNQTDIPDAYFNLFKIDGIILQIFGLWYWLVKSDKPKAKEYFLRAIEAGNANAYLSLSNVVDSKEEKLNYLQIAYENNIECARVNLGLFYLAEKSDNLALKYFLEGAECGEPGAMNNLGAYYVDHGDESNGIKYWLMAAEHGYKMAYLNLMLHFARVSNPQLFAKYTFYVNIFLPRYMYNLYNKVEDKDDLVNIKLAEYEKYKSNMYLHNTKILLGDFIGKEKMEEFSERVAVGEVLNETLTNENLTISFEYTHSAYN